MMQLKLGFTLSRVYISFLMILVAVFNMAIVQAQGQNDLNDIVKKVKKYNRHNNSTDNKQSLVKLTKDNFSEIEIYKDGVNNTSTGHAFHIHISKYKIVRHAGEWDGLCGVVDTYYSTDTTLIEKAQKLINQAMIYEIDRSKPLLPSKGITQINISLGDIRWLTLNDSPEYRNYKGDFHKLVNQLVELTGGEPDFGGPLTSEPHFDFDDHTFNSDTQ